MLVSVRKLVLPEDLVVVTVGDLKAHLRIEPDETAEDVLLKSYIEAAREQVELITLRTLDPTFYEVSYTAFPEKRYLFIPRPPLIGSFEVKFINKNHSLEFIDPENYTIEHGYPCRVVFHKYFDIPPVTELTRARLFINYLAGYQTKEECPPLLRHCVKLLAADYYLNRAANTSYNLRPVPNQLMVALASFQIKIDEGFYENNPY